MVADTGTARWRTTPLGITAADLAPLVVSARDTIILGGELSGSF